MPKKTKTGEAQPNPVVAEALTPGTASGRTRRDALSSKPSKRKATPGLKSRSSRASASFHAGSPAEPSKSPALVNTPVALASIESTPQDIQPARKDGARKKTTAAAGTGGRSPAVKARSNRDHVNVADVVSQRDGDVEFHSEQTPAADGNGHFYHDEVARLAYSYWEARGYQGGSPEDDWYQAQAELRRRKRKAIETRSRRRTRKT